MVRINSLLRSVARARLARLFNANLATRCDADLAVGDDPLARLYAFFDDDQISLTLAERHLALFGGRILFDDINKRSFSGHLGRYSWHEHGSMDGAQHETNVDEATWPEAMI